jgi:hypothetical protein
MLKHFMNVQDMPLLPVEHATTAVEECPDAAHKPNSGLVTTQRKINSNSPPDHKRKNKNQSGRKSWVHKNYSLHEKKL